MPFDTEFGVYSLMTEVQQSNNIKSQELVHDSSEVSFHSKSSVRRNWNVLRTCAPVTGSKEFSKLRAVIFRSKEILELFRIVRSEVLRRGREVQLIQAQYKLNPDFQCSVPELVDTSVIGAAIQRAGQLNANSQLVLSFFKEALAFSSVGFLKITNPVIIFGIMIDFLANSESSILALRVFSDMLAAGVSPNAIVVTSTLKACRLAKDYKAALRIFLHSTQKCGVVPTLPMMTELIKTAAWASPASASIADATTSVSIPLSSEEISCSSSVPSLSASVVSAPRLDSNVPSERICAIVDLTSSFRCHHRNDSAINKIDLVFALVVLSLQAKIGSTRGMEHAKKFVMLWFDDFSNTSVCAPYTVDATSIEQQSGANVVSSLIHTVAKEGRVQASIRLFDALSAKRSVRQSLLKDVYAWTCLLNGVQSAIERVLEEGKKGSVFSIAEATRSAWKVPSSCSKQTPIGDDEEHMSVTSSSATCCAADDEEASSLPVQNDFADDFAAVGDAAESHIGLQFYSLALKRISSAAMANCLSNTLDKPFFQVAIRCAILLNKMDIALALYHQSVKKGIFSHWTMSASSCSQVTLNLSALPSPSLCKVAILYALTCEAQIAVSAVSSHGIPLLLPPSTYPYENYNTIENSRVIVDNALIESVKGFMTEHFSSALCPEVTSCATDLVKDGGVCRLVIPRSGLNALYQRVDELKSRVSQYVCAAEKGLLVSWEEEEVMYNLIGLSSMPLSGANALFLSHHQQHITQEQSLTSFSRKKRQMILASSSATTSTHLSTLQSSISTTSTVVESEAPSCSRKMSCVSCVSPSSASTSSSSAKKSSKLPAPPPGFYVNSSSLPFIPCDTLSNEPIVPPGLMIHHAALYALLTMSDDDSEMEKEDDSVSSVADVSEGKTIKDEVFNSTRFFISQHQDDNNCFHNELIPGCCTVSV